MSKSSEIMHCFEYLSTFFIHEDHYSFFIHLEFYSIYCKIKTSCFRFI